MAIPEACGLWIEQRVQEELERKGDTGASLREIGRQVAAEVEKYFETKVKPGTITVRAYRLHKESVTNVTPAQPTKTATETHQLEKLEKPKHGGARPGAGRKPKEPTGDVRSDIDLSRINGALHFATVAISFLEKIPKDDPFRVKALETVISWAQRESEK